VSEWVLLYLVLSCFRTDLPLTDPQLSASLSSHVLLPLRFIWTRKEEVRKGVHERGGLGRISYGEWANSDVREHSELAEPIHATKNVYISSVLCSGVFEDSRGYGLKTLKTSCLRRIKLSLPGMDSTEVYLDKSLLLCSRAVGENVLYVRQENCISPELKHINTLLSA
jgi:hypothetical protein